GEAEEGGGGVEGACEQLGIEKARRFFLWLHLVSPHADYSPPPPYDTAFTAPGASSIGADIESLARAREQGVALSEADVSHLVGLYDGEVAWVDELVGRVLARLRELDLEGSTLLGFTADP